MKSNLPHNLVTKIKERKNNNCFRELPLDSNLIDFYSNDYLGYANSKFIFDQTHQYLLDHNIKQNGATGSRLISGNHNLYRTTEIYIANFHQSESALIFNSGYDANIGFFGCVPQRDDLILFDELCHASIRDGIGMSRAKSVKFCHNDFDDLEQKIQRLQLQNPATNIYVVTESVFSMDGDCPNLQELTAVTSKYNCYLVIDEAHALGVFGNCGQGVVQMQQQQDTIFARIVTFGKGLGCHGAAIVGSQQLVDYLVNFARSFVYTTGLSPHAVATILIAYQHLSQDQIEVQKLRDNIVFFNQQKNLVGLKPLFVRSKSAIQSAIIPGNQNVKKAAHIITQNGYNVKPILSPTVPQGQERLRICLHSYNSQQDISTLIDLILQTIT